MPINIEIPSTLASLCREIDSVVSSDAPEKAIAEGKKALAAYDQLSQEQKAGYGQAISKDIQLLKDRFSQTLDQAVTQYPSNANAQSAKELAILAVQAGNPQLGQRFLNDAIQQSPENSISDTLQSKVSEAAQPELMTLAATTSDVFEAKNAAEMNLKGLDRLTANDTAGAKVAFENAVNLDPQNAEHLNNLSLTQCQSGLIRQAADSAIKALEMAPNLSPANLLLATTCLKHAVSWAQTK
jgi:tetratricopeptide (TPR) repeat protein